MIKSNTHEQIAENKLLYNRNKNLSFNNFNQLILAGEQKILSFGEYSNKKGASKINKRKVIRYFYENYFKKIKK